MYSGCGPRMYAVVCQSQYPMIAKFGHKMRIPPDPIAGISHYSPLLSNLHLRTSRLGLHLTLYTSPPSPTKTPRQSPLDADHSRIVPSPDELAIVSPEGEEAQLQTLDEWPERIWLRLPSSVETTRRVQSLSNVSKKARYSKIFVQKLTLSH